jgi:hypothetical protein
MDRIIAIKPHHFVDIITALGEGHAQVQPHSYGHAVHSVSREILADPHVILRIELGADDICRPCRHNISGQCDDTIDISYRPQAPRSKREYNLLIDHRWCKRLEMNQDDLLTARELCLRIRDCAGSIADIYRENPLDKSAAKQASLMQGINTALTHRKIY